MLDDFRPVSGGNQRPQNPPETTPEATSKIGAAGIAGSAATTEPGSNELPSPSFIPVTSGKPPKPKFMSFKWRHSKKVTVIGVVLVLALLSGAGALAKHLSKDQPVKDEVVAVKKPAAKPPEPILSKLTGVPVDPAVNALPVTGIMIENHYPDARPQSGLDQAGVVFEAIAEGGITRFMALYLEGQPDHIGPVRSARPYYVQWCMSFDCSLAHVGGSPEALQNIRDWGTKDLDQFSNAGAYWRIRERYAPHNVYTSIQKLHEVESAKGYGTSTFTPLVRKKDSAAAIPNAASIDLNISSGNYNTHYDYDAASNSYKRSQGGGPHMIRRGDGSEVQLQPKVVVALIMSYGVAADKHSQYGTTGSGTAYVFQDGTVTEGIWSKADVKSNLAINLPDGTPLKLNAGQTWFTALSGADRMGYR